MEKSVRPRLNLPEAFTARMGVLLGGEYGAFVNIYNEQPSYGLRLNSLKIAAEDINKLLPFPVKQVAWCTEGYTYSAMERPAKHWAYHAGLYYIQEPSAMCPAAVLDARPGDKVLDLCAAPGGKSVQLAARLKGRGVLVSNDASASRCAALIKNLEMAGVTNAIVLNEQPKRLVDTLAEYFDKILIDAPCSGEGMFRRDPEAIKGWTANKPEMCAHTQREILHHAAALLKPGGHMVYSTCTFNPEENEGVIQAFLNAKPDFTLLPVPLTGGMESGRQEWADGTVIIKNTARIWPHRANGEGHFLALLYRKPESSSSVFNTKPAWRIGLRPSADIMKNTFKPFKQFTDNWLRRDFKGHLNFHENTLYLTPDGLPTLRGLRVMRGGWYLGDVRQERFIPSQALAMGLYNDEARYTVELTQQETVRYLKGESFDLSSRANEKTSDKQWTLVCIQGYPLGWGLLSDGRLKNKRPSGWAVEI